MCVPHRQATHAITRNEGSHATDSHAKQVYITQIYTQANREEYLANDSILHDNQDNIQPRETNHVKSNDIQW